MSDPVTDEAQAAAPPASDSGWEGAKIEGYSLLTREVKIKMAQLRVVAGCLEGTRCLEPSQLEYVEGNESEGIPSLLMEQGSHEVLLGVPADSCFSRQLTEALAGIGNCVSKLVQDLTATIEEQMLLVFSEHEERLKRHRSEEGAVRRHQWVDGAAQPGSSLGGGVGEAGASQGASAALGSPTVAGKAAMRKAQQDVGGCVGPHMHVLLEALVQKTEAEKGFIYLRDADANLLRCVGQVPHAGEASDLSLSSTCLPVTVLQTGVAAHVAAAGPMKGTKARHLLAFPIAGNLPGTSNPKEPRDGGRTPGAGCAEASQEHSGGGGGGGGGGGKGGTPSTAEVHSRQGASAFCRGVTACGVVVLHKQKKTSTPFRQGDEWLAAAAATFFSGVVQWSTPAALFAKYEPLQHKRAPGLWAGRSGGADAGDAAGTDVRSVEDLLSSTKVAADGFGDQLILRVPSKEAGTAIKDLQAGAEPTSIDAQIKECVTYIRNLELMWRNCLDEKRTLQSDVERYSKELSEREVTQASMEANYKELQKLYTKARHDVQKITRMSVALQQQQTHQQQQAAHLRLHQQTHPAHAGHRRSGAVPSGGEPPPEMPPVGRSLSKTPARQPLVPRPPQQPDVA